MANPTSSDLTEHFCTTFTLNLLHFLPQINTTGITVTEYGDACVYERHGLTPEKQIAYKE